MLNNILTLNPLLSTTCRPHNTRYSVFTYDRDDRPRGPLSPPP